MLLRSNGGSNSRGKRAHSSPSISAPPNINDATRLKQTEINLTAQETERVSQGEKNFRLQLILHVVVFKMFFVCFFDNSKSPHGD